MITPTQDSTSQGVTDELSYPTSVCLDIDHVVVVMKGAFFRECLLSHFRVERILYSPALGNRDSYSVSRSVDPGIKKQIQHRNYQCSEKRIPKAVHIKSIHQVGDEGCDDGNLFAKDGCSPSCRVEPGWTCTGGSAAGPSTCKVCIRCVVFL